MRVIIKKDYDEMSLWMAEYITAKINTHKSKKPFVLGLPTGSTPLGTYKYLIDFYNSKKLSFKNVVTFNMDEYVGLSEDHPESYHSFMYNNFFNFIDIPKKNINILNGNATDLVKECNSYEEKISSYGQICLFMGGIGIDGHIAFNEPFSSFNSKTGIKYLTYSTRLANSRFFNHNIDSVPKSALSVGIKTITSAKEVVLLISGENKAKALRDTVEGPLSQICPASILQMHENALIICDEPAASLLSVSSYNYFKEMEIQIL